MMWDLEEEHSSAYSEEICQKINQLTDLFDEILDYVHGGLYPSMMCVDVFLCDTDIAAAIPKNIQRYYDSYLDEAYRQQMQEKFSVELSLEKIEDGSVLDVFEHTFTLNNVSAMWKGTPEVHYNNVKSVAARLMKVTKCETAEKYSLNKHDLALLEDTYIGMLYSGSVINCGNYAVLVLTGCNE